MILVKRLNVVKKIDEAELEAFERLGYKRINGAVNKPAEALAKEALAEVTATVEAEEESIEAEALTEETTTKKSKKK